MNFGSAPEVYEGHSIDNNGLKSIRIVFAFELRCQDLGSGAAVDSCE